MISSWVNMLLPRLPGASKTLVEEEVKRTIDNFCRESTAWREMLYGFNITAGDREIPVVYDDGTEIEVVQLLRVYYSRQQLTPYSHAPFETSTNTPTGWTTKAGDPSTIVLTTIPTVSIADAIDVWVSLAPVNPASLADTSMNVLVTDFWEVIFDGTLGRMFSQENKPYSNKADSLYHLTRYRNGTRKARDMGNRGFTGNAQNWTFPKFGR